MLKVVHIQYSIYSAGRAALRLHNAMLENNISSSILSLHPDINDTDIIRHARMKSVIISWIEGKILSFITRKTNRQFGQYTYSVLGSNVSKLDQVRKADIIYLHWVQGGFLNLSNIKKLARLGKPVIFFMHDMWSITGGCHHSFDCNKYKTKCFDCPIFPHNSMVDWPKKEFVKKLKLYSKFNNLYFISPSRWLYNCAKESFLTKDKPLYHIPNIVNTGIFRPLDKMIARQRLNIDSKGIIIAFGAAMLDSPYKGWSYMSKALELLKKSSRKKDISLLIFGISMPGQVLDNIPFPVSQTGFLRDSYSIALLYNAADIFVTPSLADNLPTTILESMCCGTPVVGFEVGGIPEMIKHKENGYLAKYRDAEDLAAGIDYCLDNNIKGKLLPSFEKSFIIKQHLDLISSII